MCQNSGGQTNFPGNGGGHSPGSPTRENPDLYLKFSSANSSQILSR